MPQEDLEKRVTTLERSLDRLEVTMGKLSDDIHDIKSMMREVLDLSSAIKGLQSKMAMVWNRMDSLGTLREEFAVLKSDHETCRPKIEELDKVSGTIDLRINMIEKSIGKAGSFVAGRVASISDKLLWVLLIVTVLAAVYFSKAGG